MSDDRATPPPAPQADGPSSAGRHSSPPPDHDVRVIDRRWWARPDGADASEEPRSDKPSYVQELEQRLAAKDEELRTTIGRYREASQEFEQARVRARRDVARDVERGTRAILSEWLEVVDNIDRALDAARQAGTSGALVQGVDMVRAQCLAKLGGFGVKRIDAVGAPFDPHVHEAVTTVPTGDAAQDGVVVGVIRAGYLIGDDVLRPAMVAVSRLTTEGAAS